MKPPLLNAPVLLTFFVRPQTLRQVFAEIRKARPRTLFLVADGPRAGRPEDRRLNEECKAIVADIDWECDVHRSYAETNQGADFTAKAGLKWAFQTADRLIFLEDDILPTPGHFRFCEEMLERYKDDERIFMICGMNHLGEYHRPPSDYFFSRVGSIWGFAFWKRSFDLFDEGLDFVTDAYAMDLLREACPKPYRRGLLVVAARKRPSILAGEGIASFELVSGAAITLNSGLILVSSRNLISCIGISDNSGHSVNSLLKLPKVTRNLFFMKTHEPAWPLVHPTYVLRDAEYERRVRAIMGRNALVKAWRRIETRLRILAVGFYEKVTDKRH